MMFSLRPTRPNSVLLNTLKFENDPYHNMKFSKMNAIKHVKVLNSLEKEKKDAQKKQMKRA